MIVTGAYGSVVRPRITIASMRRALSPTTAPRRRYSASRGAPRGGSAEGTICTALVVRLETIGWPERSKISPRGAAIGRSRTRLAFACWTYCSPESTCRYQRRKKITPKMTIATPPMIATRRASCGETGMRGSRGRTGSIALMRATAG